jgi:hypothetical protein
VLIRGSSVVGALTLFSQPAAVYVFEQAAHETGCAEIPALQWQQGCGRRAPRLVVQTWPFEYVGHI